MTNWAYSKFGTENLALLLRAWHTTAPDDAIISDDEYNMYNETDRAECECVRWARKRMPRLLPTIGSPS